MRESLTKDQLCRCPRVERWAMISPILNLIGVRPIYVPQLTADALLLLRYGLVLIDADLDDEAKMRIANRAIAAALDVADI
jgi:hypothetical protein